MASSDGSERIGQSSGGAGEKHSADPDALAADIERTREDLAETLDAIAEKVSPRRVASRTGKRVAEAMNEGAETAREKVSETAETVKEKVAEIKATAMDKVNERTGSSSPSPAPALAEADTLAIVPTGGASTGLPATTLPSADPVTVPHLGSGTAPRLARSSGDLGATYSATVPQVRKEVVAGGAVVLALLYWLVSRKRG